MALKEKENKEKGNHKNTVYFTVDNKELYLTFKKTVKSKGLTVSGVLNSVIRKIVDGKLDIFEIIKP